MTSQAVASTATSRFTATPVYSNVLAPFLTKELPKKEDPLWGFNSAFVPDAVVPVLDRAHALTERLYALLSLSCVSKGFNEAAKKARTELRNRIVLEITPIHEGNRGSKALRELVDSGGYLRALHIYFFVKPQALHNFVSDELRQEGFTRNILHNAASPNGGASRISEPFIAFVLKMDLQHDLGLSKQRDSYSRTPLQHCRKDMDLFRRHPHLVHYERVERMLVAHEAALPPTAVLDPPKVVSTAPQALELPISPPALAEALPPPPQPLPALAEAPPPAPQPPESPSLLCRCCHWLGTALAGILSWITNLFNKLIG